MLLKVQLLLLVAFAAFGLKSCSESPLQGNNETVLIRVNHFQQTGIGEGPSLVFLIQENEEIGGEQWKYLYDPIEGFDYEPGYIYELKVRKKEVKNPPADGSFIRYILVKIDQKSTVPVDEEFNIRLKWGGENFVTKKDGELLLLDTYRIDCEPICQELDTSLNQNDEVTATFVHGPAASLKLRSFN